MMSLKLIFDYDNQVSSTIIHSYYKVGASGRLYWCMHIVGGWLISKNELVIPFPPLHPP